MSNELKPGNVYAGQLADGRYYAVRVIQVGESFSTVIVTQFINTHYPTIDDPLLCTTLVRNRFAYQGEPVIKLIPGAPPTNFKLIGNLPPTAGESAIQCNHYTGDWDEGNEVLLEWRWAHDRAALEEEVRKKYEKFLVRPPVQMKPKKMMDEAEFWSIIDLVDWQFYEEEEKMVAPATKVLSSKSKQKICMFHERLTYLLYQIDTKAHASHIGEHSYSTNSEHISSDGFLYARCAAVAKGKKAYESALSDPTSMPKDLFLESLLYVASRAYELKTGEEFEYSTGCCYETFSNALGWK